MSKIRLGFKIGEAPMREAIYETTEEADRVATEFVRECFKGPGPGQPQASYTVTITVLEK